MSTVYRPHVGQTVGVHGVVFMLDEGTEVVLEGQTLVRQGEWLRSDRDDWHETDTAAMDEAAVVIEGMAHKLTRQAKQLREQAVALRAKRRLGVSE